MRRVGQSEGSAFWKKSSVRKQEVEEDRGCHLFWTVEESEKTVASNLECGYRAFYRELIRLNIKLKTDINYGKVPYLTGCEECYEIVRTSKLQTKLFLSRSCDYTSKLLSRV